MSWVISAVGGVLVAVVLRDLFHTLYHPAGQGRFSRLVMTTVWRLLSRAGGRLHRSGSAGPLAMVSVIAAWGVLLLVGFTLVYWPHMHEAFVLGTGLEPGQRSDLLDAAYLSLVTLATLGFGDIVPEAGWLRVVVPLQAFVGFVLLTAAVSWALQVYPVLTRRRTLAVRLSVLHRVDAAGRLRELDSSTPAQLLTGVAEEVMQVRVDLAQYTESYYFRDEDPDMSLAATLGYAADLAEAGRRCPRTDVRLAGDLLTHAMDDLASTIDRKFFHLDGTTGQVLAAFADDHGHHPS